jgi:predicted RNA-binding Zn-ribbon protein involved in translation (DUF1610 family)
MTDEPKKSKVVFNCPSCGVIEQDDVIFLCNNCKQEDLIYQDHIYMCPSCLVPGDNFECMLCGSKSVTMEHVPATE